MWRQDSSLVACMIDSEPGGTGFESPCGQYISLVYTYAVTQTYNRFAPHKKQVQKIKK